MVNFRPWSLYPQEIMPVCTGWATEPVWMVLRKLNLLPLSRFQHWTIQPLPSHYRLHYSGVQYIVSGLHNMMLYFCDCYITILYRGFKYSFLTGLLSFQHCCVKLFQKLSAVNQDTVWLKLVNMWHPIHQLNPPVDGLKIIKVNVLMFFT
jgi:hypothetical protein